MFDHVLRFGHELKKHGLPINSSNLIDVFHCLKHIDISQPEEFYTAHYATLISNHRDQAQFDYLFKRFWYGQQYNRKPEPENTDKSTADDSFASEQEITQRSQTLNDNNLNDFPTTDDGSRQQNYSSNKVLMQKDIGSMSLAELDQARELIAELIRIIVNVKNRRRKQTLKGKELFLRKMLRKQINGDAGHLDIIYRKRKIKETKLFLLCDVSGSMETYSRFLIHIIYAMYQQLKQIDVAVFSTNATFISDCLSTGNINDSLNQVSNTVKDWSGGTDIGLSLHEFNRNRFHEFSNTRSIVVILSDGWDRGDTKRMSNEMKQLSQKAYKTIWLNPLLANDNYQPLCKGMKSALPFIDYFLPAHNLESFAELIEQLKLLWR